MGIFDDIGPTISDVTTSIGDAISAVSDGISSLSSILGNVSLSGVQLPLPNPLFNYASYDYIIGLASIPAAWLNDPDNTYRKGLRSPLICKSGMIDPSNRVKTPYGAFEFFIDDLKIFSQIGYEEGNNTNASGSITFKITEPYSMGLFYVALQTAAQQNGHGNWNEAPFLITIDFRGNKETGTIELISNCSRQIPIQITNISMKVNQEGSVYECTSIVYNQQALTDKHIKFMTDISVSGSTVQEVLQTGKKSLQAVINKKLKDVATANKIAKQDQILIVFPTSSTISSSSSSASNTTDNSDQSLNSPTIDSSKSVDQSLLTKLSISQNKDGDLIQNSSSVNSIGQSTMGFNELRKGDAPMAFGDKSFNSSTGVHDLTKTPIDPKISDFRFSQESDILNAISQVIMQSSYVVKSMDPKNITPEGYRSWWNIDVQTFLNGDVNDATGQKPRLIVYRVCEYKVHSSSAQFAPNKKPPGYKQLNLQAVKEYNYLYTGKNVDILKFEINYANDFYNLISPFNGLKTQDIVNPGSDTAATSLGKQSDGNILPQGTQPSNTPGTASTAAGFVKSMFKSDRRGTGGNETQATRAARAINDMLTRGYTDMQVLDMEIIGDPYFIMQSGAGNYTSKPSNYFNLNADGSMNHQNGEVHIRVNFRTPVDIDQNTGLYDFGKNSSSPVAMFSGLYKVFTVQNTFSKNEFKQSLQLMRCPLQEAAGSGTASGAITGGSVPANTANNSSSNSTTPVATNGSLAVGFAPSDPSGNNDE